MCVWSALINKCKKIIFNLEGGNLVIKSYEISTVLPCIVTVVIVVFREGVHGYTVLTTPNVPNNIFTVLNIVLISLPAAIYRNMTTYHPPLAACHGKKSAMCISYKSYNLTLTGLRPGEETYHLHLYNRTMT